MKIINQVIGFFTKAKCKKLINYYESNIDKTKQYGDTFILVDVNSILKDRLINFITNTYKVKFNYLQLVKWPNGSFMVNHYDGQNAKENDYTCICYLNSDYEGGRTIVENQYIKNDTGDLIFFNSKNMLHGVEKVKGTRYTMISWYQEIN